MSRDLPTNIFQDKSSQVTSIRFLVQPSPRYNQYSSASREASAQWFYIKAPRFQQHCSGWYNHTYNADSGTQILIDYHDFKPHWSKLAAQYFQCPQILFNLHSWLNYPIKTMKGWLRIYVKRWRFHSASHIVPLLPPWSPLSAISALCWPLWRENSIKVLHSELLGICSLPYLVKLVALQNFSLNNWYLLSQLPNPPDVAVNIYYWNTSVPSQDFSTKNI